VFLSIFFFGGRSPLQGIAAGSGLLMWRRPNHPSCSRCGQSPSSSNQTTTIKPQPISGTLTDFCQSAAGKRLRMLGKRIAIPRARPPTRTQLQQTGSAVPFSSRLRAVAPALLTERGDRKGPRSGGWPSIRRPAALDQLLVGGGWRGGRALQPARRGWVVTPRRPSRRSLRTGRGVFWPSGAAEGCHHLPPWPIRAGPRRCRRPRNACRSRPADGREGHCDQKARMPATAAASHQATGGKAAVELPGPR